MRCPAGSTNVHQGRNCFSGVNLAASARTARGLMCRSARRAATAFSSEANAGWRQENASNQQAGASLLFTSEAGAPDRGDFGANRSGITIVIVSHVRERDAAESRHAFSHSASGLLGD